VESEGQSDSRVESDLGAMLIDQEKMSRSQGLRGRRIRQAGEHSARE
jgi:hypothetical protein